MVVVEEFVSRPCKPDIYFKVMFLERVSKQDQNLQSTTSLTKRKWWVRTRCKKKISERKMSNIQQVGRTSEASAEEKERDKEKVLETRRH